MDCFSYVSPESLGIRTEAIEAFLDACSRAGLELHRFMLLRHGTCCAKVVWSPYGEDDLHPVYSFSKSLTATAIAFARQEGLLNLDERIVDLFPDDLPEGFDEDQSPSAMNLRECTIHHLLCMSCGHEHEIWGDGADWRKVFFAQPFPHKPGTFYLYNTPGSNLLAAIVLKKTGQQVTEYLRPRLFNPLGIEADAVSCIHLPDAEGTEHGGGGMSLTLDAMARFTQFMLQDGWWDGRQLLKDWYYSHAGIKQIETEGDSYGHVKEWAKGYGYQCWLCSLPKSFRADGAFGQFGLVYPTLDMCVIINAATEQTQTMIDAVNECLLPGVLEEGCLDEEYVENTCGDAGTAFIRKYQLPGLKNCRNPLFEDCLRRSAYTAESGEADGIMGLVGGAGRIIKTQEEPISRMEFAFGDYSLTWILTQGNEKKRLEAALDGTFATSVIDGVRYAATARWRALRKLELEIRRLDAMSGVRLIIHFTQDGGKLRMEADETLMTDGGLGMSVRHLVPYLRTDLAEREEAAQNVTGNNPAVNG